MESNQARHISLEAANLAVEWKNGFHSKLMDVARDRITHHGPINADDLVSVLPTVLAEIAEGFNRPVNVQRRSA